MFVVQNTPTWWVKIGDFGISKRIADANTAFRTFIGTRDYMGPELFHYLDSQEEDEDEYSNAVDIWAVGCIIFKLIAKKPPFPQGTSLRKYCSNQELFPVDVIAARTSTPGLDFLKRLLTPEPAQRPLAREAVQDPWITSGSSIESSNLDRSVPSIGTHDNSGDNEGKTVNPEHGESFPSQDDKNETDSTIKQVVTPPKNIQEGRIMDSSRDSSRDRQTIEDEKFSELVDSLSLVEPGVDRFRTQKSIAKNIPLMPQNVRRKFVMRIAEADVPSLFPEKATARTSPGNVVPSTPAKLQDDPPPVPPHNTREEQDLAPGNRKMPPSLPPTPELEARIQEARTSAKLLIQFIETYEREGTGSDLIKEFVDRCQHASRSILGYIVAENGKFAPDFDTLTLLRRATDELEVALTRHKPPALMPTTSPNIASEGTPRQSDSEKPGALDGTRHKMNKSRDRKELQPINQAFAENESRPGGEVDGESRGEGGVNREHRGKVGQGGFWKKVALRQKKSDVSQQHATESKKTNPFQSPRMSPIDSSTIGASRPGTFHPLDPLYSQPPEYDSHKYYPPIKLHDVWSLINESGTNHWTHAETECILYTNPRLVKLPPRWEMRARPYGDKPRIFYVNHGTRATSWDFPRWSLPGNVLLSFENQSLAKDWHLDVTKGYSRWVHISAVVHVGINPTVPLPRGWVVYANHDIADDNALFFNVFDGLSTFFDPRSHPPSVASQ